MKKLLDITNHKFGLLTAKRRSEQRSGTSYKWICICDCGGFACVSSNNLRTGHTDNCGCLTRERKVKAASTHGMTKSAEYQCWANLKSRCLDPTNKQYEYYGGRGITLQENWINSFSEFYEYVGAKPTKAHTLERKDNNKGYCEGNVVWETREAQAKNRGKFKSNTTGTTGVNLVCKNGVWYYIAIWEEFGKQRNKVFSINKHGLLPAMAKAVAIRQEKIKFLRENEGYSKEHGNDRKVNNV